MGQQGGRPLHRQPVHRDPLQQLLPAKIEQHGLQGMTSIDLDITIGAEQQNAAGAAGAESQPSDDEVADAEIVEDEIGPLFAKVSGSKGMQLYARWPGNANDQELIRQVKKDMRAWKLGRVVWVTDAGFNSAENRSLLQLAGGHYITGQKLRRDSKEVEAALSRQGRYRRLADNLEIKEVVLDDGTMRDRFVICRNPEAAERDAARRAQIIEELELAIADSDQLADDKRAELAARLRSRPHLSRFLRLTPAGQLRIDRAKVAEEARLDGKFVVRTSDPTLSAADAAFGYKQLWQIERSWRDMKTTLDLRPVYHRKEERIRAHVLLCWLALLLIRIAENATGQTWAASRAELERMHLIRFTGGTGLVQQRTETNPAQAKIFAALRALEPPRFFQLAADSSDSAQTA